jgi:hypothetical protein
MASLEDIIRELDFGVTIVDDERAALRAQSEGPA